MTQQHKKISENKTALTAANANRENNTVQLKDNREYSLVQRKLQEHVENSLQENAISDTGVAQLKGGKKRKRKDSESDEESDDGDGSGDFVPPQAKKQKRFNVPNDTTEHVIKHTAHKRENVNSNYDDVYTCPGCRRPLAYTKKGSKKLELTRYAFISKSGNDHEQRALALDHYPTWAPRERNLKSRGATNEEIREDHNDPDRLRAFCKVCNESHKYEKKKKVDYESDTDEEGYHTPDDEPKNKGFYKDFRKDPDPDSGGAGITT
ncbi:LSD1 subclass zinc finger protein [Flavobacterium sp. 90]|uniref:GH-E family nuclease n=1 Tax=unclassified Flavobacterium TaxID=196869 RepID=UPI000EB510D4|nr:MULTISPECIES: GH-E family nuclease [unclassified Flavobacterium]RKR04860.1 LSD1 subclass zinc finger protein [Flavobacterium sp. 81]TCK56181.1 LSD1 subclass zinc finger protein [Flavobacterium sp. 90]